MTGDRRPDIRIRPWGEGDLPLLERLLGDPAMTEFIGGPESPEQLHTRHERYCRPDEDGGGSFAIVVAGESDGTGWVGLWRAEWRGQPTWEIGWSVLPAYQGRGVAVQAAALVVESARADSRFRFIHACPSVLNGPSNAVCRKLGFTLQGEADVEYPKGTIFRGNDWRLDLYDDPVPIVGA